ncbi:T9SS type A sorting domain-containing protein [Polaribacter sp.]|nr:T9SS type A sorting domain-containing protein [Polaribacter sp.]
MKKITLALFFMTLPFIGFTQITNGTFDSDVAGWKGFSGGDISWNSDGSLKLVATAANKKAQSDPNAAPSEGAGNYILSFKVKGVAGNIVKGIIYQGAQSAGVAYTILADNVWETYTHTFDDVNATTAMNIRLQAITASTLYFDDVTFVKEACTGYAITVETDGGGTNTITTPLACYPTGEVIEFTAAASCDKFTFTQWEIDGVASGITTNPYTYTVESADASIKALFEANSDSSDTNFNTTTELNEWIGAQHATVTVDNDVLTWEITGGSTKLKYDACSFAPNAWNINALKIGYTNGTNNTRMRLSHPKEGGNEFINYDNMAIPGDATNGVGEIDASLLHTSWTGNLSQLELYIRNDDTNASSTNGTFTINYIEFYYAETAGLSDSSLSDENSIRLSPNPVKDILSIKSLSILKKLEVFNVLGQKVMGRENTNSLNVTKLNSGAYILKTMNENGTVSTKKFIKIN